MFEQVPITKRWKVIIGIICFAFVVSLLYAKQVWEIQSRVDTLREKTYLVEDADMEIVNRQVRLKKLGDEIQGLQPHDQNIDSHGELMLHMEQLSDTMGLKIIQLPQQTIEQIGGYEIASVNFSVTGDFHDILAMIHRLEMLDRLGSVPKTDIEIKTLRKDDGPEEILVAAITLIRLIPKDTKIPENEDTSM